MKGVALHIGAGDRGIQKAQVESGVVSDQDRAPAVIAAHGMADFAKDPLQGVALGQRRPQRMKGIDARDRQRGWVQAAALEGPARGTRCVAPRRSVPSPIHVDEHRGDLEQRIGGGVKAAGLDVDRDRQVAAQAALHPGCGRREGRCCLRLRGSD